MTLRKDKCSPFSSPSHLPTSAPVSSEPSTSPSPHVHLVGRKMYQKDQMFQPFLQQILSRNNQSLLILKYITNSLSKFTKWQGLSSPHQNHNPPRLPTSIMLCNQSLKHGFWSPNSQMDSAFYCLRRTSLRYNWIKHSNGLRQKTSNHLCNKFEIDEMWIWRGRGRERRTCWEMACWASM